MGVNQTCGQSAIAFLEASGVDTVFGIPGVHTLDFYKGLAQSSIRHIGVRHEQGAGFMADGYARASGKPGVCVLITGPGVVNAGTAIGQAFSDSVPMLVLSSVNARDDLGKGRGRLHEITDQQAVMAPLTAFSRTIMAPEELAGAMADAYAVFEAGRPRPVHIEIPLDVLAGPGIAAADSRGKRQPPAPDPAAIEAAARLVDAAQLLVVIAGGGTLEAGAALQRFVETSGAVLIPTAAAKGNVSDDHPQSLGSTLPLTATQALLAAADVVLAVGTELAETDHWTDRLPIKGKLIRIDLDPRSLMRDYKPDVAILADAGAALTALTQKIASAAGGCRAHREAARRQCRRLPLPCQEACQGAGRPARGPARRRHRRQRHDPDRLYRGDAVHLPAPAELVSSSGLRHPGLCPAGGHRRQARSPGARRGGRGGRRRLPLHRAGARDRRRARAAFADPALEQRCPRPDRRAI